MEEQDKEQNKESVKEQFNEQNVMKSIKEMVENELKSALHEGIQQDNIDDIGKLVDIHKDIENEEYWKKKEEVYNMRYRDYSGEGYGYGAEGGHVRYEAEGHPNSYGRRGVPGTGRGRGRYRGPENKMHEMMEHYGEYSAASEAANMGNYGAEQDSMKSLDYMLKCVCVFMDMLEEEANSPEEAQIIKKYRKKMSE
ncbi:MAG: hypothetical protein K2P14_05200 [Anaeroplasmataceae bacterium]|nr:hypothetical protein [Anaeroplasmataceae bacterium]